MIMMFFFAFVGDDDMETNPLQRVRSRSRSLSESEERQLPTMTVDGMRLGTPVAREAAKSFWSMDMFKTSLNRMAFYADCENHSTEESIGSTDSGFQSRGPSARSTPTVPQITATSAPSTPRSASRQESLPSFPPVYTEDSNESLDTDIDSGITKRLLNAPLLCPVNNSPLLMARREKEAATLRASNSNTESNHSTSSLTSSSKTISPSVSAQLLLPRRRKISRSRSAEQKLPVLPKSQNFPKFLRGAHSDSGIDHLQRQDTALLMMENNI